MGNFTQSPLCSPKASLYTAAQWEREKEAAHRGTQMQSASAPPLGLYSRLATHSPALHSHSLPASSCRGEGEGSELVEYIQLAGTWLHVLCICIHNIHILYIDMVCGKPHLPCLWQAEKSVHIPLCGLIERSCSGLKKSVNTYSPEA